MVSDDRLAEMRERTRGPLPLHEWGPKCAGCGVDEYRIDGYCSIECRDYHDDEDVELLLAERDEVRRRLAGLERWAGQQNAGNAFAEQVRLWARSMLSGQELMEP